MSYGIDLLFKQIQKSEVLDHIKKVKERFLDIEAQRELLKENIYISGKIEIEISGVKYTATVEFKEAPKAETRETPKYKAWGILSENLQELSRKYKVDFKIFATEQGMEFCQDVEVVNGEVVASNEITFDDFQWEAPDPRIGG